MVFNCAHFLRDSWCSTPLVVALALASPLSWWSASQLTMARRASWSLPFIPHPRLVQWLRILGCHSYVLVISIVFVTKLFLCANMQLYWSWDVKVVTRLQVHFSIVCRWQQQWWSHTMQSSQHTQHWNTQNVPSWWTMRLSMTSVDATWTLRGPPTPTSIALLVKLSLQSLPPSGM